MSTQHLTLPIDPTSHEQLAEQGLSMRLVDTSDPADHAAWHDAVARGFLGPADDTEHAEARREAVARDRLVGVYDASSAIPAQPVATTHCWPTEMTMPGGASITVWAISGVTVSPTHRRRGIARAMLDAELRTAVALGLPIAALTVSESTIYSRFGFSPAALARDVTVDKRRVRWTGPEVAGRVHHVAAEQLRVVGHQVAERARAATPGDVSYLPDSTLWLRQIGLGAGVDEDAKHRRLVRFDDADGVAQGFAAYRLTENEADFTDHTLSVMRLVAATPDAYAALWRFFLEMDLVSTVKAHLRPVDEPLRWMIDDFRAVHVDEMDHLWVRVLDVPAALSARTYATAGRLVLQVTDDRGFADGSFALDVDDAGAARVSDTDESPDVVVAVGALGALLLGGVRARTLVATGGVVGDAERLDGLFRSPVEPFLSTWF